MNIYKEWKKNIDDKSNKTFFDAYLEKEMDAYTSILEEGKGILKGNCGELAEKFKMDLPIFGGFLDGVNTSLEEQLELEDLTEESEIDCKIDFEKLLYNMHVAKANWLYLLDEWESVLPVEKRDEIRKRFNRDTTAVYHKVGSNEPCPCGSGKKYKKCCGK